MNSVYGCICISPNSEILLVRNRVGHKWSFPKGHMESLDKNELACARRELMEEAGIEAPNMYSGTIKLRAGSYFVFLMNHTEKCSIKDNNEIDKVDWHPLKDLPEPCNVDVSMFKRLIGLYRSIQYTTAEKTMAYITSDYAKIKFEDMNKRLEKKANVEKSTHKPYVERSEV